jgi:hypothetical protein
VSCREQAIADAKAMRQTHVEWLEHLGQCDHMDQPKCVTCSPLATPLLRVRRGDRQMRDLVVAALGADR